MGKFFLNKMLLNAIVKKNVRKSLIKVGEGLVKDVKDSMLPGTGREYKRKGIRHMASVPGVPPAPWSEKLRDSITFKTNFGDKSELGPSALSTDEIKMPQRAMGGYVVSVGSNVSYALSMERGLKMKGVEPRPYLWPALKRSRKLIKESFDVADAGGAI